MNVFQMNVLKGLSPSPLCLIKIRMTFKTRFMLMNQLIAAVQAAISNSCHGVSHHNDMCMTHLLSSVIVTVFCGDAHKGALRAVSS